MTHLLILLLIALVVYHFVIDAIIAPSIRLHLRFDLFAVRDDLRRLKADHGGNISPAVFNSLQQCVNNGLTLLYRTTLTAVIGAEKAIRNDKGIQEKLARQRQAVADCAVEEVRQVEHRIGQIALMALAANSAGWLPVVLLVMLLGKLWKTALNLRKVALDLAYLPAKSMDRYFIAGTSLQPARVRAA